LLAIRIVVPAIALDSPIVESPIQNGAWVVPRYVVGHLAGTADPLTGGNVVLAGHVESYAAGHVFERISQLTRGAVIRLYTRATVIRYVVQSIAVVPRDDLAVLNAGPRETVTLITCAGTWVPWLQDYDRRTVVVALRAP
jgi:LPXTG-site transpeptidase (sortase) family protein